MNCITSSKAHQTVIRTDGKTVANRPWQLEARFPLSIRSLQNKGTVVPCLLKHVRPLVFRNVCTAATINAPLLVPANAPANPSASGSEGSFDHTDGAGSVAGNSIDNVIPRATMQVTKPTIFFMSLELPFALPTKLSSSARGETLTGFVNRVANLQQGLSG